MTPSKTEQSHTHSRTCPQPAQRIRAYPPTISTEEPYRNQCIDPEARRQLVVNQLSDRTEFVYHLWHGWATNDRPSGVKYLAETYLSPELARHDAVYWLINTQNWAGASTKGYWTHHAYEEENERCYFYCTDYLIREELGISYVAWTTAARLR